jgi:DNA-binding LytR/AlgR family response regulator
VVLYTANFLWCYYVLYLIIFPNFFETKKFHFILSCIVVISIWIFFDYVHVKKITPALGGKNFRSEFGPVHYIQRAFIPFTFVAVAATTSYLNWRSVNRLKEKSEKGKELLLKELSYYKAQFNSHFTLNFFNFCYNKTLYSNSEAAKDVEKFSDIEMPNLNGLDFIESLRQKYGKQIPKFIFTTGYHKYALSGYEKGVVDFLVKPIGFTRFKMSIDRIIDNWKDPVALSKIGFKEHFYVEVDGIKIKMNYENIMYVESDRNCVHIFDKKGKKTVYQTMQSIEELLSNDDRFVRIHKSYIVSESFVESIKGNDIVMDLRNGTIKTIPIGRTYKKAALKRLLDFNPDC